MGKRVLIAGIYHETNTFLGGRTTLEDFETTVGEEILGSEGDFSPMAGVLEVARKRRWEVLPAVDLRAAPGPTVADEVVETFWKQVRERVEGYARDGIDGVCLVLHGAMVTESFQDAEGEILRRLRGMEALTGKPVCGVLDLHANFSEEMAAFADGLIAYRENPHIDAKEAAVNAALLLDRLMQSGEKPVAVRVRVPLLWPPTATGTSAGPMRALEESARRTEREYPEVIAVNVFGGFPFADVPQAGVCLSAVTLGDPARARRRLQELAELAVSLRSSAQMEGLSLEEAMRRLKEHDEGPVLLVEPSDNVGGGAPGDNTRVLAALLEHGIQEAGVVINDPETVASLSRKQPGHRQQILLGGKSGAIGAEPLPVEVEVLGHSSGRFSLEDPRSHLASMSGRQIDMGACVLVRCGGVVVLVTSRKTPPFDLAQWRSQGINPEELFVINIKAAAGHRRAYDPIAKASYTLDLPGPCAENLKRLPFRHVRRPVHPLDEDIAVSDMA
ncbi:M81 family peptidase [Rubrobacter taiwanensis]|uniref:M81 family peptidase n=1 Tax=Rubrobacter taiwanensis TaxID=185139 RepID=A0A4V2NW16_9ACTN|nr:M81 family metallopeptidase [Rubrobacter taiwanensis]TCJ15632.1 M81 family peptidase [Rubrobacter taiwanensis]